MNGVFVDLTGKKYSKLLVIKRVDNISKCKSKPRGKVAYLCLCDCGTEKIIKAEVLRNKGAKSCSCSQGAKGKESHFWNGGLIERKCLICNNVFYAKKSHIERNKGKFCSRECYRLWRKMLLRDKCPNWMGGKSFEPYTENFDSNLRDSIRSRDLYICAMCGYNRKKYSLDVHHIDYNKKNCSVNNLVSLCRSCHSTTNGNRDFWRNQLISLLKIRNSTGVCYTWLDVAIYCLIAILVRRNKWPKMGENEKK
jgi:hypothetical protein